MLGISKTVPGKIAAPASRNRRRAAHIPRPPRAVQPPRPLAMAAVTAAALPPSSLPAAATPPPAGDAVTLVRGSARSFGFSLATDASYRCCVSAVNPGSPAANAGLQVHKKNNKKKKEERKKEEEEECDEK